MLQDLLALLPRLGTVALVASVAGAMTGAGLWLMGARFSRSLITLLLVSAGATLGLQLPRWFAWPIDGWAPALGVAALMGISGFLLHRFWVGVSLGTVLTTWAALATWAIFHGAQPWAWPAWEHGTRLHLYLQAVWNSLPTEVCRLLPFACGAALISGVSVAMLWPRIGLVLLYSTAGVSLLVGLGLVAVQLGEPHWIYLLPAKGSSQGLILLGMVGFGALLQWYMTPRLATKAPQPPKKPSAEKRPNLSGA